MRIVVGDVGSRVMETVFELDVHPHSELLDIDGRCAPVDSDLLPEPASLVRCEGLACLRHATLLPCDRLLEHDTGLDRPAKRARAGDLLQALELGVAEIAVDK
jgi:hypothetical protein